jgi:hypothetical protein
MAAEGDVRQVSGANQDMAGRLLAVVSPRKIFKNMNHNRWNDHTLTPSGAGRLLATSANRSSIAAGVQLSG